MRLWKLLHRLKVIPRAMVNTLFNWLLVVFKILFNYLEVCKGRHKVYTESIAVLLNETKCAFRGQDEF